MCNKGPIILRVAAINRKLYFVTAYGSSQLLVTCIEIGRGAGDARTANNAECERTAMCMLVGTLLSGLCVRLTSATLDGNPSQVMGHHMITIRQQPPACVQIMPHDASTHHIDLAAMVGKYH